MRPSRVIPWFAVVSLLAAADLTFIFAGLRLAYSTSFHALWLVPREAPNAEVSLTWIAPLAAAWLCMIAIVGLYRRRNLVSGLDEYQRVWAAGVLTVMTVIVFLYLATMPFVARGFIFVSMVIVSFFICLGRMLARRVVYFAAERGWVLDRVVIVGTNRQAIMVARELEGNRSASACVIGFLSEYLPIGAHVDRSLEVLGDPLRLTEVAAHNKATSAVIVESGLSWESLQGLVRSMHRRTGIQITLVPGLFDMHSTPMHSYRMGSVLGFTPAALRIVGTEAGLKRALDILIGVLALLVAAPVALVVALRSLLTDQRIGLKRVTYLAPNGGTVRSLQFTSGWSRRAHLARLPELVAVVLGRLSLVGPRPLSPEQADSYGKAMAFLESAKPGFIGPWWLVGVGRPIDTELELLYDLYYLRNYSIWLDIQILVQALRSLVSRQDDETRNEQALWGLTKSEVGR